MTPICVENGEIILSSAFAKKAKVPGTQEYRRLQEVRRDYPGFTQTIRQFKTNNEQDRYRGLTYKFMRDYISSHEEDPNAVLDELEEMIGISKCHSISKRYPTIKRWFLDRYPAVKQFGVIVEEDNITDLTASEDEKAA